MTLYYAATDDGDLVSEQDVALASTLVRADGVHDLIPDQATQITGADGRYSWGVPEGLWYVTAKRHSLEGDSNDDVAATVNKAVGDATNLLPVLPVQLDVNIPLTDHTAPAVTQARYTEEGVYVTFSKYMVDDASAASVLNKDNYTVRVNGAYALDSDVELAIVDQGHVPANLKTGAGTTYTKTVLIGIKGLEIGDTVAWTVAGAVESYAGTPLGADYSDGSLVESKETLAAPVLLFNGVTAVGDGDSVEVASGDMLALELAAGAPAGAKIYYQLDGETEKRTYTKPFSVAGGLRIEAWTEAAGYEESAHVKADFALPEVENVTITLTASKTSLNVTEGSSTTVTLTLTHGGAAVPNVTVTAVSADETIATVPASAVTDANGQASFRVKGVKPGSTKLTFSAFGRTAAVNVKVGRAVYVDDTPAQPEPTVTVTGAEEITAKPEVRDGAAEAAVEAEIAAEALKDAEAGDTLTVKVETENADTVALKLTADALKTVAAADVDTRIETEHGAVKLSAQTLDTLAEGGKDVAVTVKENEDGTTTFDVSADGARVEAEIKVELPAAGEGQVLVIVKEDGSEEIVKKSVVSDGTVYAILPAGATVRLADKAMTFPDVAEGAWYFDDVAFVSSHGLFQGTDKGFEPSLTMTRAMLATVLYRLEDAAASGENPFADVADGMWYTEAVIWASEAGIVNGMGDGFYPNAPVSREQIATMLFRYANYLGLDTTGRAELDGFPDGGDTASWAAEAMQWAVSAGLFRGNDDGTLNPKGDATRAEVAALLQRMITLIVK